MGNIPIKMVKHLFYYVLLTILIVAWNRHSWQMVIKYSDFYQFIFRLFLQLKKGLTLAILCQLYGP